MTRAVPIHRDTVADFAFHPPRTSPAAFTSSDAEAAAAEITRRVREQLPAPGSEAALRQHIASLQLGDSVHAGMTAELRAALRSQPRAREAIAQLGPVQAVVFKGVGPQAAYDVYEVTSAHGVSEWRLGLNARGETEGLIFHRSEAPPPVPPTRGHFQAQLRARLDEDASSERFSGAVLVAKGGAPIFEAARGFADRERGLRSTLETRFRIASMNKMFTAVATLQLAEAGALSLDDTLGKHLVDYPNPDVRAKVTVRHLLTHTGGTGDIFGPEYDRHRQRLCALEDYARLYGRRGLAFEPGHRFAYSSYGFVLLGLLIEKLSGGSYHDYVQENVFRRAGMTATGSLPEERNIPGLAVGYTRGPNGLQPNTSTLPPRGTSAGGGYSTVRDLFELSNALRANTLLSPAYAELLTTATVSTGNAKCTYGFFQEERAGVRAFGHDGGALGMSGAFWMVPSTHYVIAILSNFDPPAAHALSEFIIVRLPR